MAAIYALIMITIGMHCGVGSKKSPVDRQLETIESRCRLFMSTLGRLLSVDNGSSRPEAAVANPLPLSDLEYVAASTPSSHHPLRIRC